jgi:uncharacterized protein (TIGR02265 family)
MNAVVMPPPGFVKIDTKAPMDVDAYLAHCPEDATVKGVILNGILKKMEKRGVKAPPSFGPFHAFKTYPLREHMKLTVEAAKLTFPRETLREALRQLGQTTYPEVLDTLIGKVVFGALGKDPGAILKLSSKAYQIIGSRAQAKVVESGRTHIHTHVTNAYGFLDSFHYGTSEGVLLACGRPGTVHIKRHQLSEAEFFVEWQ